MGLIDVPGLVDAAKEDDTEQEAENSKVEILLLKESCGTVLNVLVDYEHLGQSGFGGFWNESFISFLSKEVCFGHFGIFLRIILLSICNLDIGGIHFDFVQ